MKLPDLLDLATRNLRESLLRNSLTTIGIAVGVASLVAMLSLGVGLQQLVGQRLGRSGLFETIVVSSRQDFQTRAEERGPTRTEEPRVLNEEARRQIETLPGVVEVYPELRITTDLRYGGKTHFAFVGGLPPSASDNEVFEEMQGAFFSAADAPEALVQMEFAAELADDPASLLGQEVVLRYAERQPLPSVADVPDEGQDFGFSVVRRELPLRIVGLFDQEPFGGMRSISRARIFIPVQLAEQLNVMQAADVRTVMRGSGGERTYFSLMVRAASPARVPELQQTIDKMGLRTFSILDATRSMRRFFAVLDIFLGIFGSLALAVASLAIVNTLVMAVLERRREIGILKALGASEGDVKRLFFAEAGVMGLVGGAAGVVLAFGIGMAINFGTARYLAAQELPPETVWAAPWWLVLGAIAFAVLVSLLAGLYPAARAARLDPVQALRYE